MGYVTIHIKRNLYRRMEQGNICVLLNFQLLERAWNDCIINYTFTCISYESLTPTLVSYTTIDYSKVTTFTYI